MWPAVVVVIAPESQLTAGFLQRVEPFHVQTLIAQPSVEALDKAVLDGPARPDERQLNSGLNGPDFHHSPGELAAVVQSDAPRRGAALGDRLCEGSGHFAAVHRMICFQPDTFARKLI